MGAITRTAANNFTTGGVILPAGINDASVASITDLENITVGGGLNVVQSQTASSSASISFTTGINSTYPVYKFEFINIHPQTESSNFEFQFSTNGGSSYATANLTTNFFRAVHGEDGSSGTVSYETDKDLANSSSYQRIGHAMAADNANRSFSGTMYLFSPSNTTYVTQFLARGVANYSYSPGYAWDSWVGGWFKASAAVDAVQFRQSSGNIDDGIITLYGISGS